MDKVKVGRGKGKERGKREWGKEREEFSAVVIFPWENPELRAFYYYYYYY